MPLDIDPKSDFVFKMLFGRAENVDLLLDLLTAILRPTVPIVELRHVDPSTRAAFAQDDVTTVDVAARDAEGFVYQIEVQVNVRPALRTRILYASSDVLQGQLQRGSDWAELRPVIAIWILAENLFHEPAGWQHRFMLRSDDGFVLSNTLTVHVVELRKWRGALLDDSDRWAYFLRDAARWDRLPAGCDTPALEKAMAILYDIAKDQEFFAAHRRRMSEIDKTSDANELARLKIEVAAAQLEVERANDEKVRANDEKVRANDEKVRANDEKVRANEEKVRANEETARANEETARANEETARANEETARANEQTARMAARLRAAGLDP